MNFVFVIKTIAINGGGAERVIVSLTSELSKIKDLNITLVTFDNIEDPSFYPIHANVKLIKLGIGKTIEKTSILEFLKRLFSFRKLTAKLKPDIVIGFNSSAYIMLWISLLGKNIPLISSEHSSYSYFQDKYLQKFILNFANFFSKKITVLSEIVLKTFPEHLQKNMSILPNPIMHNDGDRVDVGLTKNSNIILSVGRLSPEKNHIELIESFSLIANEVPQWKLRIIGDGPLRSKLNERISQLELNDQIILTGSKKDISKEYMNANFFVLPSKYEGFSLVIAEALSYGLPVIGFSDCEGILRLVEDKKNGMIVSASQDRIKSLSKMLLKMIKDNELRLSLSVNCKIPKGFDTKLVISKWLELFEVVLKKDSKI